MGDVSTIHRSPGSVAKGGQVGELVSAGWTNDSHDMYISSMEASFMQQLRGQQLQHHHAHAPARNMTHVPGHGLKALQVQNGASNELRSETRGPCSRDLGVRGLPQDPWARRFRPHKNNTSGVNRRGDVVGAWADDGESGTDTVRKTARTHGREVDICAGEDLVGESSASGQNFPEDEVHSIAQPIKSCKKRRTAPSTAAGSFRSMLECSDERW